MACCEIIGNDLRNACPVIDLMKELLDARHNDVYGDLREHFDRAKLSQCFIASPSEVITFFEVSNLFVYVVSLDASSHLRNVKLVEVFNDFN